jgi:ubiquinone/menaquinone biosynthesis C-methylase UbiE
MDDNVSFRRDLYRGTAAYYDRFRLPYPHDLIEELVARTAADGEGRLLDLACGTGQIAFALHPHYDDVWAVDQELEMVSLGRAKAERIGTDNIRWYRGAAERFEAPDRWFELVTIGNAFHRLPRRAVAARAYRWLEPGGHLALLWSDTPWRGSAAWQTALNSTLERWQEKAGATDRIPPLAEEERAEHPDEEILHDAGFSPVGSVNVSRPHLWTPETLIGFVYSTSFLSRAALGEHGDEFEEDLRRQLTAYVPEGLCPQTIGFACQIFRRG